MTTLQGPSKGSIWIRDDFRPSFQQKYLATAIPFIVFVVSVGILLVQTGLRWSRRKRAIVLPLDQDVYHDEIPYRDDPEVADSSPIGPKTDTSMVKSVPRYRYLSAAVEIFMLVGLVAIQVYEVTRSKPSLAGLIVWLYALILTCIRLVPRYSGPNLWYHTAWIYGIQWCCLALVFRSQIIHPTGEEDHRFAIVRFSMVTKLLITAFTTRKGNRTVWLAYEDGLQPSQEPLANLFSNWTFVWVDGIVWQGYRKTLELGDVWNLAARDKAAAVLADFRQVRKSSALAWHLLKYFERDLVLQALWAVISGLFTFAPTLLLKLFLEWVEDPLDTPVNAAWFYMILLALSSCVKSVTDGQALWLGRRVCIRLRAIIVGEIYAKALRRKAASGGEGAVEANVGTIINLMAVDSFKVSEISAYLHFLWGSTPVQLIVCIALLYRILGLSSLAGIVMMVLVMPLNLLIAKQFSRTQKRVMAATDVRIHTTNEILQNIRIVKYFAWEHRFAAIVNEKRQAELRALRNKYILWTLAAGVWFGVPILITFFSFLLYTVVEKRPLVPSVAFTALSLFGILRYPLDQLADMIAHVQESKVSIDRIEEFLREGETQKYQQLQPESWIGFRRATLAWTTSPEAFRLLDLDAQFVIGRLNVIAGPTGAGKTSLLMALLGEMSLLEGQVALPCASSREDLLPDRETHLTESVAYCAQQAWLVNDNIRENILFAAPFDEARYRAVISACALERDLEILDQGDLTLVGEKGITLSGGQKQRISLARALYSNSRHVLLDDCLSAVDSHTAQHIFEFCILGSLMHHRTCILVTHNLALCVPRAQHVVAMVNGRIAAQGPPKVLVDSGALGEEIQRSRPASRGESRIQSRVPSVKDVAIIEKKEQKVETKAQGSVKFRVIRMYLAAMGPWYYWLFALLGFTLQQLASVGANVWIRTWANAYTIHVPTYGSSNAWIRTWNVYTEPSSAKPLQVDPWYYLWIYAGFGISYILISLVREGLIFWGSLRASDSLHQKLFEAVTRARLQFFDTTPLGQLMNRFSKDVEAIDQDVSPVAVGVFGCLFSLVSIIVLICVVTPKFLFAGIFISIIYFAIGAFYLRSSRDLKRLESVQRSPIYQQFGETLAGVVTIRAYGEERRFLRENQRRVDTHNRPFIYLWATNRWLALRVDFAGALVAFFAGVFVILSIDTIDAGSAGLSLTYAVMFTENVLWLVRLYSANEQNMNSVERMKEYMEVEQEAAAINAEARPPGNWPSHGAIQFFQYTTRYRADLDPVLRDLTFSIQPGERIGIVGRTGAGKSSLALALFRGLEADQGKILIDDVDIALIGLQDLREAITIVPQDPTLFTGTVRSNLDPFGLFTDEQIFAALRRVQLLDIKEGESSTTSERGKGKELPSSRSSTATGDGAAKSENVNVFQNLGSSIAESGSNLSQGQRQLLCLARALLKTPRVLLMDEATASIDYATDNHIQATLREVRNSTVITIAHRLQTIIDYDKVLVLDKGRLIEFDSPALLIQREGSIFRGMCEMSGDLDGLIKAAMKSKF